MVPTTTTAAMRAAAADRLRIEAGIRRMICTAQRGRIARASLAHNGSPLLSSALLQFDPGTSEIGGYVATEGAIEGHAPSVVLTETPSKLVLTCSPASEP